MSDTSDTGTSTPDAAGRRRDIVLLAVGAGAGIALAVYGLLAGDEPRTLPADAAARVNGRIIDNADLADALAALGADSRDRLDEGDRDWILGRLVEEELLVQRALALDLGHADRSARAALVDAMVRRISRDAATRQPSEDELRDWYADNRALFAGFDRVQVEAWTTQDDAAARRLLDALETGADDARPASASRLSGLPTTLLPPAKLRDYLGPTLTARLMDAPAGTWIGPLPYAGGRVVARVADRRQGQAPPFREIRDRVEVAWRRAQTDAALAAYLTELRERADIETAGP